MTSKTKYNNAQIDKGKEQTRRPKCERVRLRRVTSSNNDVQISKRQERTRRKDATKKLGRDV